MLDVNATQLAKQLRDVEGYPTKVAVKLAKALILEDQGDHIAAEKYLDAAIAEEEKLSS